MSANGQARRVRENGKAENAKEKEIKKRIRGEAGNGEHGRESW